MSSMHVSPSDGITQVTWDDLRDTTTIIEDDMQKTFVCFGGAVHQRIEKRCAEVLNVISRNYYLAHQCEATTVLPVPGYQRSPAWGVREREREKRAHSVRKMLQLLP
eukprot:TRINITY_DN14333_c0_g1_i1.p2 TRINITY_DN14333_c0_g1~~TRINITY_DN14333_c0_g1_i1.p2  ORF type:complete len:107 (-),score=12.62 TRINITY_DN14333_c0_g1_i1:915-1235(-)